MRARDQSLTVGSYPGREAAGERKSGKEQNCEGQNGQESPFPALRKTAPRPGELKEGEECRGNVGGVPEYGLKLMVKTISRLRGRKGLMETKATNSPGTSAHDSDK